MLCALNENVKLSKVRSQNFYLTATFLSGVGFRFIEIKKATLVSELPFYVI